MYYESIFTNIKTMFTIKKVLYTNECSPYAMQRASNVVSHAMTFSSVTVSKYSYNPQPKTQSNPRSKSIRKRREVAHKAVKSKLASQSQPKDNRESTY